MAPKLQWVSPTLSDSNESIIVPSNGLYAIHFAPKSPSQHHLLIQKNTPQNTVQWRASTNDSEHSRQSPEYQVIFTKRSDGSTVYHTLPFEHNGVKLTHLSVGKLVYLLKGSTTRVQSTSSFKLEVTQVWEDKGTTQDTSIPPFGHVSTRPKCLTCRTCGKSFLAVQSVHHHLSLSTTCQPRKKRKRSSSPEILALDNLYQSPLQVLHQDQYLAIINKPQGMAVQGARPCLVKSDLLLDLRNTTPLKDESDKNLSKPRIAHRLDAATGGLLVVAKTKHAEQQLKIAFQNRHVHKRYRAIVHGRLALSKLDGNGCTTIEIPVANKPSQSLARIVRVVEGPKESITIVDLWPITGRQHQLRKHMKYLQCPIVGDVRYGRRHHTTRIDTSRLCLWSVEVTLPHPITHESTTVALEEDPTWIQEMERQVLNGGVFVPAESSATTKESGDDSTSAQPSQMKQPTHKSND